MPDSIFESSLLHSLKLEKENTAALTAEVKRLRESLKEIRDVARCSDGVDFYAMLADNALSGES